MARVKFDKNLKPMQILSLGAGKQSTFMLLQALEGAFFKKPDYAVFADTGNEPDYVYKQLELLEKFCITAYNFKIQIVSGGNLFRNIQLVSFFMFG